ncbi:putative ABC transport system permease protein [Sporomusaceae bacterium BoRhaA]|uniref:ABC transporter permease n=1 Tax=Pelorhabdus rhamnosifermentans TaxID=2772457 RepID=UPI001C06228E|nr:ABC transporter permease [Pelorhabdus rhamnosifermentans]MBU2701886.1 putative ABC transport system permease protein [Pelorhabdus rhamnosifermentans]
MFSESIIIALDGLRANKLRAMLTMLGIIIGVGAVIAMVSIGMGVRDKVESSIAGLGSNLLIVRPGAASTGGSRQAAGSGITLNEKDALAIAREVSGVNLVAPTVDRSYQIVFGNQNWTTTVQGTTSDILGVRSFNVQEGAFFTNQDIDTRARVAVLGKTVADNLFNGVSPVGKTIRINKAPFRVVGVLEGKGQSAGGGDQDDTVIIPLTTAQERLLGITYVQSINVQATGTDVVNQVQEDITTLLRTRHKLPVTTPDDFKVQNMVAVMATADATTGMITLLLGVVAALSLLVGGIGIMNIMLVSVTERTREIGIRKALGARYRNILLQFLIEAVVISVAGGLLGIALGIGSSYAISAVAGWKTIISSLAIMAAFGFSVLIGLFFGIYPARKAALLDPIEALRYE